MANLKELKPTFHRIAYDTAQSEVCNSDCECYAHGVCPCKPGEKTKCYYFKHTYEYHYFDLLTKACLKEQGIKHCTECDRFDCCPHGLYEQKS